MKWDAMRLPDMRELSPLSWPASWVVAGALVSSVLLVGCAGGDDKASDAVRDTTTTSAAGAVSSSSASSAPASSSSSTEVAVLADYTAAKAALDQAQQIPDPSFPDLERYWTGEILAEVKRQLVILQTNGWVIRGTTTRDPKVKSINDSTAVVWDCVRTDGERYDAKTGDVVNPTGPLTLGFEETLVHEAGVWKISARVDQEQACASS